MTTANERATDLSFKKLSGYQYTSTKKAPYEEQGTSPVKVHSSNVWSTSIPVNPYEAIVNHYNATATTKIVLSNYANDRELVNKLNELPESDWTDGMSFQRKTFALTVNTTVANELCWIIGRFNSETGLYESGETVNNNFVPSSGYIGTQYGTRYAARLFINGSEIGSGDPCGWNFDYDTGILTFLAKPVANISTVEVICYQYIGQTGEDSNGEPFDDVLGTFIIEPSQLYLDKTHQVITRTPHHIKTSSQHLNTLPPVNVVAATSTQTTYNSPTSNLVFRGGDTVTEKTAVTANTITVEDMNVNSTALSFTATGDVALNNFESSGNYPKAQGNAQISINTNEKVTIYDSTFGETGYNTIEIGLGNTAPKQVTIDKCKFVGAITNNAISIFRWADNALITISNCVFEDVSNVLRISNVTNKNATINFTNCTFKKWETGAYAGVVLCQDYTNTTPETFESANLFAPNKIKINFVDCIGPNGNKIDGGSDPATYSASGDDNQLLYVYGRVTATDAILPYDVNKYPQVTFA